MKILATLALVFALCVTGAVIVKKVSFKQECSGHLKRAADANSVELAKAELKTALDYIEANGWTHGYTSIIYKTPDEDISFWYQNLKVSYDQIAALDSTSTTLEKSNTLMKLRETLLDTGSEGKVEVTYPSGLAYYPSNFMWALMRVLMVLGYIAAFLIFAVELDLFD